LQEKRALKESLDELQQRYQHLIIGKLHIDQLLLLLYNIITTNIIIYNHHHHHFIVVLDFTTIIIIINNKSKQFTTSYSLLSLLTEKNELHRTLLNEEEQHLCTKEELEISKDKYNNIRRR